MISSSSTSQFIQRHHWHQWLPFCHPATYQFCSLTLHLVITELVCLWEPVWDEGGIERERERESARVSLGYVYVCVCVCVYVCVYTCVYMCVCMCVNAHVSQLRPILEYNTHTHTRYILHDPAASESIEYHSIKGFIWC